VDPRRDQLLGDRPGERPLDAADVLVDRPPGKADADYPRDECGHARSRVGHLDLPGDRPGDHDVAEGLEGERAEVGGRRVAVMEPEELEGLLQRLDLARRLAVLHVVALGEGPVLQHHLGDGHVTRRAGGSAGAAGGAARLGAVGEVAGDDAVVYDAAPGGVERAEVNRLPAEDHDGLSGGLVESVGGDAGVFHGR
jgi:hypothetical protein